MKQTSIVLIDREPIFRGGLRLLLAREPDFAVLGECGDGLEGLTLIERLKPDVVVANLIMPGLGGSELTRRVKKRWPRTRVVILTSSAKEQYVLEAMAAGALAYVLKDAESLELGKAIREAMAGRRHLSSPFSDRAIESYLAGPAPTPRIAMNSLTGREREVFQLAAEGLKNAAIALRLGISPRTSEKHRSHALHKLALNTQTDLVLFAIANGVLPPVEDALAPI